MNASDGARLFARYAYSPNELGYCGPAGADYLARVARGEADPAGVRAIARQFSGAWAYQLVIGQMLGLDPLDHEVVRGYWTGTPTVAALDPGRFWERLLAVIGPQAGPYWRHLDDGLAPEARAWHAFHVLGVYPWARLLPTGRPEVLEVLNNCLIRPGRVLEVAADAVTVATVALTYSAGRLTLEPTTTPGLRVLFDPDFAVGEHVALHWGAACDRLTETESTELTNAIETQLDLTNRRLGRA